MDKLKDEVRKVLDQEIMSLVRVSGIYVQTVLTEAEKKEANIKIDLNLIENKYPSSLQAIWPENSDLISTALENMKKFETKSTKDFEITGTKPSKGMGAKLPTLSVILADNSGWLILLIRAHQKTLRRRFTILKKKSLRWKQETGTSKLM